MPGYYEAWRHDAVGRVTPVALLRRGADAVHLKNNWHELDNWIVSSPRPFNVPIPIFDSEDVEVILDGYNCARE